MPSRLIKDENGMCAGADFGGDLIEVQLHGLAVAGWQNQAGTGTLFRADCAEQIRLRALVVNVARS